MNDCKNCGEPVVFMEAPEGIDPDLSYWTHRYVRSNWCYMSLPDYQEMDPARRDSKAEVTNDP